MKNLIFSAIYLLLFQLCESSPIIKFNQKIIFNNNIVTIKIEQRKFSPDKHRINQENWKIDGASPMGLDFGDVSPKYEINSFSIDWNGKTIPMPSELYSNCFSPNLNVSDSNKYIGIKRKRGEAIAGEGVLLRWDENTKLLSVIMVSMEWASAPYFIIWKIGENGVSSRECVNLGS